MKHLENALVIGASGGIGLQVIKQLHTSGKFSAIHAVSRTLPNKPIDGITYHLVNSENEQEVRDCCLLLGQNGEQFSHAICCIGALHGQNSQGVELQPEKRLEDVSLENLSSYFVTNTITPALWLKHALPLFKGTLLAKFVFLSARVGSISDNKIGGWYGYRASKAALNMLLKTAQVEYQRRAKNVSLVSYHPGTVDTALSKPFQANVPEGKLFTPEFTVNQLFAHLDRIEASGELHYIDWQGKIIPW